MSTLEDGASTLEDGGSMVEDSVCPTEADEGVVTLEEARRVIRELRDRHRSQSRQLLAWKRRVKAQVSLCGQYTCVHVIFVKLFIFLYNDHPFMIIYQFV